MFELKNLQIHRIDKSMKMLRVVMLIHLANLSIRIISTLALDFIWIEKETKTMNLKVDEFCHKLSPDNYITKNIETFLFQSSSFNLWIISMILYIIGLLILLFHFLPKKAILSKLIRQIQRIDQQTVTEKMNFVKRVGYFMILGNIITILSREWIYSLANLSTVRMSEVFLYNVMISIFVIKETRLCILLNSLEIFLLNFMNFYVIESHQKYRVLFNSMTSLIISSTLMFYSLRDYKDSFETKKSFQDHVSMMRRILELFPSGLMFFEKQKCIYKNRFWYDLVKKSLTSPEDIGRIVYPKDELEEKSEILLERIRSIKDDSNSLLDEIFAVETKMRCSITKKKLMKKNGFISFKTNENSDVYEFELKSENGHQLAEFATKFSIFEFSSRDTLLMVVINDVSDQLKMKEARMHEQLKSVMLCSVSHELHSPINQINGTLTLLEDNVPQSGIPLIKIAKSSTELLKLKVDDILDFGEIQTQHFKLETEDFNPRKLGIELDEIFSPVVNSSKIELYFIINEKTPMVVHHDYKRIKQILANFMGNSVKYCKRGMITLRIGWEPINEQRGYLKFSISDTGIGIPKEKRKNLFNYLDPQNIKNLLNSQDHNTTTLAGTGLGISAKIIQEMGSKIDYISTEGEGSKFWFKILTYKSNPDQRLDSASSSFGKPIEYESEMNYPKPLQIDERKDQIDLGMNQAVQSPCSVAIETGKLYTTDEILDCFDENHSDGVSLNNQTFTYEDFMPFNRSVYSGGDSNVHSCGDPRMLYKERERRLSTLNLCKSKKKNQKKQISLRKSKSKLQEKNLSGDSCAIPEEGSLPHIPLYVSTSSRRSKIRQEFNDMLVEKKKSKFFNLNKDGLQKDNKKSKEEEKEASRRKSPDQGEETPEHFPTSQFFLTKPMTLENINEVMKEDRNAIKSKPSAVRKTRSSNVNPITIPNLHHFLSPKDKVPNYLSLKGIASENGEYISHRFQKDCECPSILIVDDQYINRFIIKQFCDRYHIPWVEAEDGRESLNMIKKYTKKHCCQGLELILMDLNMPIMGGIEAAVEITKMRENYEINPSMKLIAVTAFTSKTEEMKCMSVGFDEFISKPFKISHFLRLVSE